MDSVPNILYNRFLNFHYVVCITYYSPLPYALILFGEFVCYLSQDFLHYCMSCRHSPMSNFHKGSNMHIKFMG